MSKEDVQKKASAAEAVLTLEAVSTVKGLVGPAVKPKKRAAAKRDVFFSEAFRGE